MLRSKNNFSPKRAAIFNQHSPSLKRKLEKFFSFKFNCNFVRRITRAEKALTQILFFCAGIILVTWYLQQSNHSVDDTIIEVDWETWSFLNEKLSDKIENIKSREKKIKTTKEYAKNSPLGNKNFHPLQSLATEKPYTEKDEWIFELLRNSRNIKSNSSFPRDSSLSIIENGVRKPPDETAPIILVWWPPIYLNKSKKIEQDFQGVCGKCRLTTDRSQLHRSNVVLFDNIPNTHNLQDLPPPGSRRPEQSYVLWHRETPAKTFHLKKNMVGTFDKMFNYTLSYRKDSDIYWYLGNSNFARRSIPRNFQNNPNDFVDYIIRSKRKLAVWIVSNCNDTMGAVARLDFAQKLINAGLRVDRFGKCFNKVSPRDNVSMFLFPYKFYLAFENSWHCKDYLTEKFWRNGLMSYLVPVIWGPSRDDVAAMAPPHSYIHVEDFKTPKELINYLNYLDRNESAYRSYFNWRLDPVSSTVPLNMLRPGYQTPICKICRALNENKGALPHKTLPSAIEWVFIDGDDSKCLVYDMKK